MRVNRTIAVSPYPTTSTPTRKLMSAMAVNTKPMSWANLGGRESTMLPVWASRGHMTRAKNCAHSDHWKLTRPVNAKIATCDASKPNAKGREAERTSNAAATMTAVAPALKRTSLGST